MSYGLIDSELVCENCGYTEDIIINSEKTSYKDPPREASYFAYKRINHFNEWLATFQAKETTDISQEVYNNILKELKKNKNFNINKISYLDSDMYFFKSPLDKIEENSRFSTVLLKQYSDKKYGLYANHIF